MTALALWFVGGMLVGLLVGRCIRVGAVDLVAEEAS